MASNKIKTGYTLKCANDECDKQIYVKKGTYEKSPFKLFACCRKCKNAPNVVTRRIDIFEQIHGVRNKGWTEESQQKIKETNLEKFGCINPFQNEEVKNKIKKTNLEKYGVVHAMQNKEMQEKATQTRIEKYGKENLMGYVPRDKYEEVCLERYGVKHFFQCTQGKQDLESLKITHGVEKGEQLFKELGAKKAITLENMIKKHGIEEGPKRYQNWKDLVSNNLDNFIRRHGEQEGEILYKDYVLRVTKNFFTNSPSSVSKISLKLFDHICSILSIKAVYGNNEWFILNENNNDERKMFLYDFKYKNKILEFNGDFWHANPLLYKKDQILNFHGTEMLAEYIWIRDEIKIEQAKQKGFDVLVIWEKDYKTNKEAVIKKCCEFLKDAN